MYSFVQGTRHILSERFVRTWKIVLVRWLYLMTPPVMETNPECVNMFLNVYVQFEPLGRLDNESGFIRSCTIPRYMVVIHMWGLLSNKFMAFCSSHFSCLPSSRLSHFRVWFPPGNESLTHTYAFVCYIYFGWYIDKVWSDPLQSLQCDAQEGVANGQWRIMQTHRKPDVLLR